MHASENVRPPSAGAVTDAQLERINRYTRQPLGHNEVFVFSVILCDNEIDRDFERFPLASLEKLGGLFEGKTGLFDHSHRAQSQSARIFETAVTQQEGLNSLGEPLCCLRAWAYMLRGAKNEELIREIDAGIKKEVSVGCAVGRVTCSICGADRKTDPCPHQKGEAYAGRLCHHLLEEPTDAYEWSFVAVPAQKNAGVTKWIRPCADIRIRRLDKLFEQRGEITLCAAELDELDRQYRQLKALAAAGREWNESRRREVVRLALLAHPALTPETAEAVAKQLDGEQLAELKRVLHTAAGRRFPLSPQLGGAASGETPRDESPFKI